MACLATKNFLGNTKADNCVHLINDMLQKFNGLNVHMNIKIYFLCFQLDRYPENLGAVSNEQGERFHQNIKVIKQRYEGRWDPHMMADYYWTIMRENISF